MRIPVGQGPLSVCGFREWEVERYSAAQQKISTSWKSQAMEQSHPGAHLPWGELAGLKDAELTGAWRRRFLRWATCVRGEGPGGGKEHRGW